MMIIGIQMIFDMSFFLYLFRSTNKPTHIILGYDYCHY